MRQLGPALLISLLATAALAAPTPRDDPRLALVRSLQARLLDQDSATAVLEAWCGERHLAQPPRIVARLARRADVPASPTVRQLLHAGPSDRIRYRRVRLACGAHVLSEADNWYLPGRLTPEMNRLLDETDTPFGKAVKPLGFHRETLSAQVLARTPQTLGAGPVVRNRAVLSTPDGAPFSYVVENYTPEVLADGPGG